MQDDSDDEPYTGPIPEEDPHAGEHPLFWDHMPEDAGNDVTFQAMEALKAETTPKEQAESYKASSIAWWRASTACECAAAMAA